MDSPTFYFAVVIFASTVAATTLAWVAFGVFRHKTALWLALSLGGLVCFALTALIAVQPSAPGKEHPGGFALVWQALGAVFLTHCVPRFALAAFGTAVHGLRRRALDALTLGVGALSLLRVVTGWTDRSHIPDLPNAVLEALLFGVIGGVLGLTLIFQSRLPDRNLYRTVLAQGGVLLVLVPWVLVEDLGLVQVPGFPLLAGQLALGLVAVSAAWHTATTLLRPKYVVGLTPSPYFVDRFGISPRELDIVRAVLDGQSNKEMADRLFISTRTVEKHLSNIYQKVGIKSRLQLVNLLRSEAL